VRCGEPPATIDSCSLGPRNQHVEGAERERASHNQLDSVEDDVSDTSIGLPELLVINPSYRFLRGNLI